MPTSKASYFPKEKCQFRQHKINSEVPNETTNLKIKAKKQHPEYLRKCDSNVDSVSCHFTDVRADTSAKLRISVC
jgi:hypothetical protein